MPKKKSNTLTKAELRVMEQLWAMGEGSVKQVLDALGGEDEDSVELEGAGESDSDNDGGDDEVASEG